MEMNDSRKKTNKIQKFNKYNNKLIKSKFILQFMVNFGTQSF